MTAPAFDVSVGLPGEDDHCTIVVGGTDLEIPLEMDLDDDPLQDDEIRLVSEDGSFEMLVRASDPEAEADVDNRFVHYHFLGVPRGTYRVEVNVGGRWNEVLRGLVVHRGGVVHGGAAVGSSRPTHTLGPGGPTHDPEAVEEPAEDESEFLDLNEGYADV